MTRMFSQVFQVTALGTKSAVSDCILLLLQLDTDDVTVESAVTKNFDKVIHLLVDPVWHQLSAVTKQLIADLKTLREMLQ